jgi:4-hydroxy-3-polyprenylbenzoate decarboxylase
MNHRSTRDVVVDLQKHGRLIEVTEPVSPCLEMAEIQRRVYERGGPALLFSNVPGSRFPMASNLFGSLEQARFLFRKTIDRVRRAIELKIDPTALFKNPFRYASAPWTAWSMLPKSARSGPVLAHSVPLSELPQLISWPRDGGAFVTLPQVLSMGIETSLMKANLGMYRIQLSGNEYEKDREMGLHYQLHRGIGVHQQAAMAAGKPFRVTVTVGGTPAMTLAAVMPLPEGLSELTFAGALAGHRIPMITHPSHAPIYADADFMITGTIDPERTKPEGPFGDHLGYYAKVHEFPFMRVERVSHRPGAIWPFTVVGRPPQEDTTFGELIHELTGDVIPTVLPGVKGVHAVDAAGVHPLLLAIGSERYTPYRRPDRPQELLTQANAILGQGQLSLAKYLWIANQMDAPELDIHDIAAFFRHMLERVDWSRDLHFQTRTTIDTLDYSGEGFNQGSKVVIAATGSKKRDLHTDATVVPKFPATVVSAKLALPGVFALQVREGLTLRAVAESLDGCWEVPEGDGVQMFVLTDDCEFAAKSLKNWLWVTFTRSNPAIDIDGVRAFSDFKHWGCRGPLLIDARIKPHHAPPLVEDPEVNAKVDAMAARGGPISKFL